MEENEKITKNTSADQTKKEEKSEKNNNKKGNGGTVIIVIIIIWLFLIGIYYYFNYMKKEDTRSNTNVNNTAVLENNNNNVTNTENTAFKLTKEQYPKVDGATAMKPMSVEIAKSVLGMTDDEANKFIVHNTTGEAYQNLIDKKADVIFVSEPSDDIKAKAKAAGVEFEMVGLGYDGFVFLVNKDNPISSLTVEQIQKIYTGQITNWKKVGGEDLNIIPYQREANSGSQNLMEKMVMKGQKMTDTKGTSLEIESMAGLVDTISSQTNSKATIGYSIYVYAKEQYVKDNVKFLGINGVYPSDETITNKQYPLTKVVYAIYRKDEPENSNTRKLVNWLLTSEGQKAVEAGGYVKIK